MHCRALPRIRPCKPQGRTTATRIREGRSSRYLQRGRPVDTLRLHAIDSLSDQREKCTTARGGRLIHRGAPKPLQANELSCRTLKLRDWPGEAPSPLLAGDDRELRAQERHEREVHEAGPAAAEVWQEGEDVRR